MNHERNLANLLREDAFIDPSSVFELPQTLTTLGQETAQLQQETGQLQQHVVDLQQGVAQLEANKQNNIPFTPENAANKGEAGGYAPLDETSKVPLIMLPPIRQHEVGDVLRTHRDPGPDYLPLDGSIFPKDDYPELAISWQSPLSFRQTVTNWPVAKVAANTIAIGENYIIWGTGGATGSLMFCSKDLSHFGQITSGHGTTYLFTNAVFHDGKFYINYNYSTTSRMHIVPETTFAAQPHNTNLTTPTLITLSEEYRTIAWGANGQMAHYDDEYIYYTSPSGIFRGTTLANLVQVYTGNMATKVRIAPSGNLLAAVYVSTASFNMVRSTDNGATWHIHQTITGDRHTNGNTGGTNTRDWIVYKDVLYHKSYNMVYRVDENDNLVQETRIVTPTNINHWYMDECQGHLFIGTQVYDERLNQIDLYDEFGNKQDITWLVNGFISFGQRIYVPGASNMQITELVYDPETQIAMPNDRPVHQEKMYVRARS